MRASPAEEPVVGRDAWDRLRPLWHALFAGILGLATVLELTAGELSGGDRTTVLLLTTGFALWHWLVVARHPDWWERRLAAMAGYWLVAGGFTVALVYLADGYTIVMYALYPLMFITLGWWGMVPIVGLSALVGWALGGWGAGPGSLANLLATAGLAALIAVFIGTVSRQSAQRRDALEALAATRSELADTARRTGVLEERERLARELHDTIAQGFTSIVTHLEAADQAFDERPTDARGHLDTARRTARDGLGEVRRSVQALRPDLLEGASLGQALDRAVRRWSADSGVPAELRTTGEPVPLHPDTETALLRTAQEALANVAKHAAASRVVVSLSYLGDTVTLDVDDDGAGFDGLSNVRSDGGFGLVGMRERISAVGGELSVESAPGQGTTIAASVPS